MTACLPAERVQEAFLQAPPLIAKQILDLTVKFPNFLRDIFEVEEWPRGAGTFMEQIVFRGAMPKIERGLNQWKKIGNISGCGPADPPNCSYNWTQFGGHSFDRKITELMAREFRSPEYCISEIQTTAHFREVFAKIVENLYAQTSFFKEYSVGQNILTMLAKKFVVDSDGAKIDTANIYAYPNIGTARLSNLNIGILEFFYEQLRRMPSAIPYDVVDGQPIYALLASHQTLARIYRDDPNLRQDVRFSGLANDLVMKYNFMSTIRGMFFPAPIMYPRRFNIVAGEPVEVLPFNNDIPSEVGVYTDINPGYESATHEEVLMHGRFPFKIFFFPTETTLGENTSFGPEASWMNTWLWVNPLTSCDPFRRVGYFATSAKMGVSQQFSEGIYGILVERVTGRIMAQFNPEPNPLPTPVVVNNSIPATGCPCPLIVNATGNPITAGNWFFTFASLVTGNTGDPVQLALDNGGYVSGTLVDISADGYTAEITLPAGFTLEALSHVISIFCDNTLGCSATVVCQTDCRADELGSVKVTLSNPIKADADNDIVLACFADGTSQQLQVVGTPNLATLEWRFEYAAGFGPTDDPTGAGATNLEAGMFCDRGGIIKICVPPTTDATCPACEAVVVPCT